MGKQPLLKLDVEQFLSRYWQQAPLLLREALPDFEPPVTADELAGLALEEEIEARIIEHRGDEWLLHHGPFKVADYQRESPWTLLVQAVDHHLPAVAALRHLVDFLPRWRVDDIMVSYAIDGGSVGPHYDHYDVFLLQGEGQRLWRLGQSCDPESPLVAHDSLRILAEFDCRQEYLLNPGDILYLPPGVAHWGIARGECTTFSVGFRAPRINAMVSRWADHLLEQLESDLFYCDPGCEPAVRPGEIRPRDLARARDQLQDTLNRAGGDRWFGELVTEPRYDGGPGQVDIEQLRELLRQGACTVELLPEAKLAWQEEPEGILVFANGHSRLFPHGLRPTLEQLCGKWRLDRPENATIGELLEFLLECETIDAR